MVLVIPNMGCSQRRCTRSGAPTQLLHVPVTILDRNFRTPPIVAVGHSLCRGTGRQPGAVHTKQAPQPVLDLPRHVEDRLQLERVTDDDGAAGTPQRTARFAAAASRPWPGRYPVARPGRQDGTGRACPPGSAVPARLAAARPGHRRHGCAPLRHRAAGSRRRDKTPRAVGGRHFRGAAVNAASGAGNPASTVARCTTIAAIRSRSSVVFPVPGGPFTENRPPLASSARIVLTANCWLTASGLPASDGQRASGKASGRTPFRTVSRSSGGRRGAQVSQNHRGSWPGPGRSRTRL